MRGLRQNAASAALAVLLASAALASLSSAASAQESEAERTAAARSLFVQGMEAVDAGDFDTAADRLARSLELRDSPVVRTNLALALIELGRLVEASEHLRTVQRDTEEGSQAHRVATERLEEILPRLGQLQIDVGGASRGVEVRLDGEPVSSALIGVPQPADPGSHRVSLWRLEREIAATDVQVVAGQRSDVALVAPPPTPEELAQLENPVPGPLPPREPSEPAVTEQWWFWTILVVLVVGAGVGLGVGLWAADQEPQPWLDGFDGLHTTILELP